MSTTPCDRCEGAGEIQATHGWTTYGGVRPLTQCPNCQGWGYTEGWTLSSREWRG